MSVIRFPKRSLTIKEKLKLELLEAAGTVQNAIMDKNGPLTHIHAFGLSNQEEWHLVIQEFPSGEKLIFIAKTEHLLKAARARGLEWDDWDPFTEEF